MAEYILHVLFLICTTVVTSEVQVHRDVNSLCDTIHCIGQRVCRVAKQCQGPLCPAKFFCMECIPSSVDEECNAQGYRYAVGRRNPRIALLLEPLTCSDDQPCPFGATCVAGRIFSSRGVCCYGGPHSGAVDNDDYKCRPCVPACREGYTCYQTRRPQDASDDLPSCDASNNAGDSCDAFKSECRPDVKSGHCSSVASIGYENENENENEQCPPGSPSIRRCENDQDCSEMYKCCPQACNGTFCEWPIEV